MYETIVIQNNQYGYQNERDDFISIGRAVLVKKRFMNIDNKRIKLLVHIYYDSDNYFEQLIERSEFFSYNCDKLVSLGADIVPYNKKIFQDSIRCQEEVIETEYLHSKIGFNEKRTAFYSDVLIGVNKNSLYDGNLDIKPNGSLEEWSKMVNEFVLPNIELQLSVILGLSSALVGYLQPIINESLIVHLFGRSSSGKSTALLLALSCSCNPTRKNSLMTNWNSTFNSIYALLANNNGYVFGIDELSSANERRDFSDIVYNLANGAEKDRLTSGCNLKSHNSWATTIISTGETSLLAKCNRNDGLNVRVLEFNFNTITPNAEVSNNINKCIKSNYGFALIELVNLLFKKNEENISYDYYEIVDNIKNKINVSKEFSYRLSQKVAIILLTVKYANQALKLNFNQNEIFDTINSQLKMQFTRTSSNLFERFMEVLIEDITSRNERYCSLHCDKTQVHSYNDFAIIKYLSKPKIINGKTSFMEILFFKEKFATFIKEKGFTDETVILKTLKSNGILDTDKDNHFAKYRTINDIRQRVYVMYLTEEYYNPSGNDAEFSEFLA